ncbi:Pfs domain protein [Metarhizium brunneum]
MSPDRLDRPSQHEENGPRHSITKGTSNPSGYPPNRDGFGDASQREPPRSPKAYIDFLTRVGELVGQRRGVSPPPVAPSAPAFGSVPSCTGSDPAFVPVKVGQGLNPHRSPTLPSYPDPARAQQPKPRINWPESVRNYVNRSFLLNNNDPSVSRAEVDDKLKETITTAAENGTLYTTQWDNIPLPQALIKSDRDALYNRGTRAPSFESAAGSGKRKRSTADSDVGSGKPRWHIVNSRYCSAEPTEITAKPELKREPATLEPTISSVSGQPRLVHQRDGREGDQKFEQWRPLSSEKDSKSQGPSNGARSNYSTVPKQAEGIPSAVDSGYASLPNQGHKAPAQSAGINANQQLHPNALDTDDINLLYDGLCSDDADSIYTAGPGLPLSKKNAYIFSLADDLLNKAFTEKPDEDGLDRIEKLLPQLLKTFAMKVGSSHPMQIYRDIMVFVRRHRRLLGFIHQCIVPQALTFPTHSEITKAMRDKYNEENGLRSDVFGNNVATIDPGDLVRRWCVDTDTLEDPNTAPNEIPEDIIDYSHYEDLDEANPAAYSLPELSIYKDFISKLPEYKWLLERIQEALYMDDTGNVQTNIRDAILQFLPRSKRISRGVAPQTHNLTFTADWDPCEFLQQQEYLDRPERALERAITITGSETDAQAATTTHYLSQTWPSSGVYLLQVLKRVVQDTCTIPYPRA